MKILQLRGYILFLSLGLLLFFLGAFTVILVRTKSPFQTPMPNLVGKNYTSVHNELLRLRMKVILEFSRLPEKNEGEILSQSVSPGKAIEAGAHVYLTVNQGYDRVEMPNVKGQNLGRAREILDKVLSGEIYVSMPIGGITYIEAAEGESADTVVDQIPAPGKITTSGEKVYLLVTEPPKKTLQPGKKQSYANQPMPFVAQSLNRIKFPWKIREFQKVERREQNGLVLTDSEGGDIWELTVGKAPEGNRIEEGYEFFSWKVDKSDTYQVRLVTGEKDSTTTKLIQLPQGYREGETLNMAVYRTGVAQAQIQTLDEKIQKKFNWKPEL